MAEGTVDVYRFQPLAMRAVRCGAGPRPRSGHRIVADDRGNLFSYGGYNPAAAGEDEGWPESQPLFRELWRYNMASGSWHRIPADNIPAELVSNCLFFYKDSVMVFGGTGYPFGAFSSNSVAQFNVKDRRCRFDDVEVSGDVPCPLYGQGFILDDHYLYTVGGTNGYGYSADVHRLDLDTGCWELLYRCTGVDSEPYGRYRHELAFDGQKIYMLGGGTVRLNACLVNLPVFDLSSRRWDYVKSNPDPIHGYPSPRKYHSCVKVPGELKFLVIGGYDDNDVFSDSWILDVVTLTWRYVKSMELPSGTYFHGSIATVAGKLFTFGGVQHVNKQPQRTDLLLSAWLTVPSLGEMCWDALQHYGFTRKYSKHQLRSIGVPLRYIDEM